MSASAGGGMVGASVVKLGVTLIERTVPKGLAYLKSWWKGKSILVVGQARAGKTTFIDYLRFGIFDDEKDTDKTHDVERSPRFNIAIGKDQTLVITVKTVLDVPGQVGAVAHAKLAFKEWPHAILIFLDLTTPLDGEPDRASKAWLAEFCKKLEEAWRASGGKNKRLKSIILVMNKKDKVKSDIVQSRKKSYKKVLEQHLGQALGSLTGEVPILPCVLVNNRNKTKDVDAVIARLAKDLAK